MTISREDVLHVARLAEIGVSEHELEALVDQMNRIVGYVAQLDAAPVESDGAAFVPGPAAVAWREDVVQPEPLAFPPAALAPDFRAGFFVVPQLPALVPESQPAAADQEEDA
jgi:aspartyl-tRNA(Asn)/glutamyl-tRNA(Gln) amidotransferase subunit C